MSVHKSSEWFELPAEERHMRRFGMTWYKVPFALGCGEWKKFYQEIKIRYPVQHFIRETVGGFLSYKKFSFTQRYYELKCQFFTPHNVIKLDIPPTWHDTASLIPIVLEKLLVDFVDKEKPFEFHDWDEREDIRAAKAVVIDAYDFFKNRKPALTKQYEDLINEVYGRREGEDVIDMLGRERTEEERIKSDRASHLEAELNAEETRVLVEIIKIRNYLWT